jgi:hypothetical protein
MSVKWGEKLLYIISNNCDLFGSGMFKYNIAQLYKRFLNEILVLPRGVLDTRLMNGIKFYMRFLAKYVSKIMIDRVLKNCNFSGRSLIESKNND